MGDDMLNALNQLSDLDEDYNDDEDEDEDDDDDDENDEDFEDLSNVEVDLSEYLNGGNKEIKKNGDVVIHDEVKQIEYDEDELEDIVSSLQNFDTLEKSQTVVYNNKIAGNDTFLIKVEEVPPRVDHNGKYRKDKRRKHNKNQQSNSN